MYLMLPVAQNLFEKVYNFLNSSTQSTQTLQAVEGDLLSFIPLKTLIYRVTNLMFFNLIPFIKNVLFWGVASFSCH